jgi:hypothetical protein
MRFKSLVAVGVAVACAYAGVAWPQVDKPWVEWESEGSDSWLVSIAILAVVAGGIKLAETRQLGGFVRDLVRGLGWIAGLYLHVIAWLFLVCGIAAVGIGAGLSKSVAGSIGFIAGSVAFYKLFPWVHGKIDKWRAGDDKG